MNPQSFSLCSHLLWAKTEGLIRFSSSFINFYTNWLHLPFFFFFAFWVCSCYEPDCPAFSVLLAILASLSETWYQLHRQHKYTKTRGKWCWIDYSLLYLNSKLGWHSPENVGQKVPGVPKRTEIPIKRQIRTEEANCLNTAKEFGEYLSLEVFDFIIFILLQVIMSYWKSEWPQPLS